MPIVSRVVCVAAPGTQRDAICARCACYAHAMCRSIDLHLCTPSYRYIDPLLNDSAQASPVTDGYALGVTLLQALTGLPVANLKVLCRATPSPNLRAPSAALPLAQPQLYQ